MAMPTGPLSRNWELLRKRLDAAAPPKRKAAAEKEEPTKKKLKRRRADDTADTAVAKKSKPHKVASAAPRKRRARIMSTPTASDEKKQASAVSASLALWAEDNDIPPEDLARAYGLPLGTAEVVVAAPVDGGTLEPEAGGAASKAESGRYIAMDCEMVGVGEGEHESSALARVSIVNFHGHCVLDCFVQPKEKVTDWRTWVSGVSPKDMVNAIAFEEAQKKVADMLDGRILVGHAIKNDLECLLIGHPKRDIRDTSRHPQFRKYSKGRTPGLKKLAKEILGIEIQVGSHSSIEDARACMLLYRRFKDDFERENQIHFPNQPKKSGSGKKKNEKTRSK